MLQAGRAAVQSVGFAGLTVRGVAAAANINLGSFVYHFKTRDAFVRELIEDWYAPLLERIEREAEGAGSARTRLRSAILQLIDFGAAEEDFVGRVLIGAMAGESAARDFLGTLAGRHPRVLLSLVRDAQAESSLVEEDPLQILIFLMAPVGLPRLLAAAWNGPPLFGKTVSAALGRVARDRDRILQRLDWALAALTPGELR